MAAPSYTYTLTNGTTADADQVMQNFTDVLNGITDATKDLSINALTVAGTATLNGHVNIGNASGDDLIVTASLASSLPIKTTNSYDIGSSTLGLRAAYFGANSQTTKIVGSPSMSATWTMTLPVSAGTAGFSLATDGAGVTSWVSNLITSSGKTASYTVLDTDGIGLINVTTAPSAITFSSRSSDTVTFTGTHGMLTGCPIVTNAAGTYPTGLTAGVLYYAIVTSTTACKFATTVANALAGTAVTLSADGSGTRTWAPGVAIILPTDNDNTDRRITVIANYATSTTSPVAVIPESGDSSTIGGATNVLLQGVGDRLGLQCNGSDWLVTNLARKPISARYHLTGASSNTQLANNTSETMDYEASDYDSHSSVTVGANWVFTARRAMKVMITASVAIAASSGWAHGELFKVEIRQNSTVKFNNRYINQVDNTSPGAAIYVTAVTTLDLAVGDTVDVRPLQDSGGAINFATGSDDNCVSIHELSSPNVL